jgi:hypothetical protein
MAEKDLEANPGRGPCRICYEYEDAGELIAPCLCKGSSRWIHRDCLDRWRSSGFQRAFTNCRECGFQYHLQSIREEGTGLTESQQKLLQTVGRQTILTFLLLQLLIMGAGMLIRLTDREEAMVQVLGLPQEPEGIVKGDFFHALKYHKTTYYLCGLSCLLCIAGVIASALFCCSGRRRRDADFGGPYDMFDVWACHVCCDDCGRSCSMCDCACPDLHAFGSFGGGDCGGGDCGECFIVVVLVAAILAVVVGIFAAILALVTGVMNFFKRWAQLTQMRALSKEYVVVDLASPDEGRTGSPTKQAEMISEQLPPERPDAAEVQRQLAHDLNSIFGDSPPRVHGQSGYGSMS